jgi:hypothetical protein
VLKLIDLTTLEITKDSFIEKELADYHSDMPYKVKTILPGTYRISGLNCTTCTGTRMMRSRGPSQAGWHCCCSNTSETRI